MALLQSFMRFFRGIEYHESQSINGTDVSIVIRWKDYTEDLFSEDVEIFNKINSGEWSDPSKIPEDKREDVESAQWYEILRLSDFDKRLIGSKTPSFTEFKRICCKSIAQLIFYSLKTEGRDVLAGKSDFVIDVVVNDSSKTWAYAAFQLKRSKRIFSNENMLCIDFGGSLLVGRIYMPFIYTGKMLAPFLQRTIQHEFQHYLEHMKGMYSREAAVQKRISRFMKADPERWGGSLPVIYEILSDTYTEGIANLKERSNASCVKFDLDKINKSKEIFKKTSLIQGRKKARDFYEEALPDSEGGAYYIGYLMCYFIGLSNMKKTGAVRIFKPRDELILLSDLDRLLSENKLVHFAPLDQKTFDLTFKQLKDITHFRKFIRRFEDACRELGLSDSNIFFSRDFVEHLIKNALNK